MKDFDEFQKLIETVKYVMESTSLDEQTSPVASKDDVYKMLVKKGHNKDTAKKIVDKEYDFVVKSYKDATTAGKIADIISRSL